MTSDEFTLDRDGGIRGPDPCSGSDARSGERADRRHALGPPALLLILGALGFAALDTHAAAPAPPPPGFRHATAQVDGATIHYLIGGHGPPVVLLHGWPVTAYAWRGVAPALADRDRRSAASISTVRMSQSGRYRPQEPSIASSPEDTRLAIRQFEFGMRNRTKIQQSQMKTMK